MKERGFLVGEKLLRDIRQVVRIVLHGGIRGPGVRSGSGGVTIAPTRQRQRRPPKRRGITVRWGKATGAWSSGNTVTLTPVVGQTDGTATGAPSVTAYIVSPSDGEPANVSIDENDILAYADIGGNEGILWPVKMGGGDGAVDLKQEGATVKVEAEFIDIPATRGSSTILQFAESGDGGTLTMKEAATTRHGIFWNGTAWQHDVARYTE